MGSKWFRRGPCLESGTRTSGLLTEHGFHLSILKYPTILYIDTKIKPFDLELQCKGLIFTRRTHAWNTRNTCMALLPTGCTRPINMQDCDDLSEDFTGACNSLTLIKAQASSWCIEHLTHSPGPNLKEETVTLKSEHSKRRNSGVLVGYAAISKKKKKLLKNKQNKNLMTRRQREASLKIKELFSASNAVLIIHKSYIPPNVLSGI